MHINSAVSLQCIVNTLLERGGKEWVESPYKYADRLLNWEI